MPVGCQEDFAVSEEKLKALGEPELVGDLNPASLQCPWESAGGTGLPLQNPAWTAGAQPWLFGGMEAWAELPLVR